MLFRRPSLPFSLHFFPPQAFVVMFSLRAPFHYSFLILIAAICSSCILYSAVVQVVLYEKLPSSVPSLEA